MGKSYNAFSDDADALKAYGKIMSQLTDGGKTIKPELVIFASDNKNFNFYSRRLAAAYPDATVIGSTNTLMYAGKQYSVTGIVVMAVTDSLKIAAGTVPEVSRFPKRYVNTISKALEEFSSTRDMCCFEVNASANKCEEMLMDVFDSVIGKRNIPIVGYTASASRIGEEKAYVSLNGEVYEEACVFAFIKNKNGRIGLFKENMFKPTGHYFSATDVDCDERRVYEYDGMPAAQMVASSLGISIKKYSKDSSCYPMGRVENGDMTIIAPNKIDEDFSIDYHSRIYSNTRVELLEPEESLPRVWRDTAQNVHEGMNEISFCIIINCYSRLDYFIEQDIMDDFVENLDKNYPHYFGVSGHGEQMDYRHHNQTMLILAFE